MYKAEIPSLFVYNELLVISDGFKARLGTLTAGREWFKPWKTISGERVEGGILPIEVLLKGVFEISSKPPGSRNPTSPSFRTNSSTKSGECPRRTSPWNCCANSSMGRSKFVGGKASSSTAASQRCSRKPSDATTTGPSKRWKLSRNSLSSLEKSGGKPPWRSPRPLGGRARLLRSPGNERQGRPGSRRAHPSSHCPGARLYPAGERHRRLDDP